MLLGDDGKSGLDDAWVVSVLFWAFCSWAEQDVEERLSVG